MENIFQLKTNNRRPKEKIQINNIPPVLVEINTQSSFDSDFKPWFTIGPITVLDGRVSPKIKI